MKIFLLILLSLSATWVSAQSFNDFKNEQTKSMESFDTFDKDKANIDKEFQSYKRIATEEFNRFSGKVQNTWGDKVITTDKVWVEYTPDMMKRRIVNFETGEIIIQVKKDLVKADNIYFAKDMAELIQENNKNAFENDEIAQNIEKRMKNEKIKAEYSPVPETPILLDLVLSKKEPSVKEIASAASDIVKRGSIKDSTLPNGQEIVTLQSSISVNLNNTNKKPTLTANTAIGTIHKKAASFKDSVIKYAKERNMPEALVYAVIHNESSFNPMAKSHVPAYGMMQLVPTSGGKEASSVYFGKPVVLSPSYLYNSDNNIKLGTTYLSQLYYNYFKGVKNLESRLYCAISGYNTGPGNVSRAFTGERKLPAAISAINNMTPKEVYNKLYNSLPYEETRTYLKRVTTSYNGYKDY